MDSREAYWEPAALAMHQSSSLYHEMENKLDEKDGMLDFAEWLREEVLAKEEGVPPRLTLAGSSVHFDRAFLINKWPEECDFEGIFTHRNLDVSSVKLAIRSFCGDLVANTYTTEGSEVDHRALSDIRHSIGQLLHFRKKGLIGSKPAFAADSII
jgi:oligoribonuclease (3'-5' exoribonuclease)